MGHYMTHPSALPSRSIARTSSGLVSAVSDLDSVTSAGLDNENDNASERYDFILHDSRDDELNGTSTRKRGAGSQNKFRSVSTGRANSAGGGGGIGGVSTVGSVSGGGSVMGRVTGMLFDYLLLMQVVDFYCHESVDVVGVLSFFSVFLS